MEDNKPYHSHYWGKCISRIYVHLSYSRGIKFRKSYTSCNTSKLPFSRNPCKLSTEDTPVRDLVFSFSQCYKSLYRKSGSVAKLPLKLLKILIQNGTSTLSYQTKQFW